MYVLPFAAISPRDRPIVGHKGAGLAELTHAGINIPPGFVLSTLAFERFMAELDVDGAIRRLVASLDPDDLAAVAAVTTTVQQKIHATPLPADIEHALEQSYLTLTGSDRPSALAVRRSTDASFAGLQDNHLYVRSWESLLASIRSCWASLYSTESVTYRLRLRPRERQVVMGVVIQTMVDATRSGVIRTRGRATHDLSVLIIQGSWGLGSWVLDDEITPDEFVVSRADLAITQQTIAEKQAEHVPHADADGVRKEAVPAARQSAPCLQDDEIIALAELGIRVEHHYGSPQYIEWAIGRSPTPGPYLLQSDRLDRSL